MGWGGGFETTQRDRQSRGVDPSDTEGDGWGGPLTVKRHEGVGWKGGVGVGWRGLMPSVCQCVSGDVDRVLLPMKLLIVSTGLVFGYTEVGVFPSWPFPSLATSQVLSVRVFLYSLL